MIVLSADAVVAVCGGWGTLSKLFLPALTLSLPFAAYIARLTRMGMIDALTADAQAAMTERRRDGLAEAILRSFAP